jgi:hypothetical protein
VVCILWHKTWFDTLLTVGMGFTVMVNDVKLPVQVTPWLVKVGVTVIVAITGALVMLVAVKEEISPEPEAAIPIEGFEFVQL